MIATGARSCSAEVSSSLRRLYGLRCSPVTLDIDFVNRTSTVGSQDGSRSRLMSPVFPFILVIESDEDSLPPSKLDADA